MRTIKDLNAFIRYVTVNSNWSKQDLMEFVNLPLGRKIATQELTKTQTTILVKLYDTLQDDIENGLFIK